MGRTLKVLGIILLVTACAVNPVTGKREISFLSPEQEIQFGESVYPAALWGELAGGGPYTDPTLTSYLAQIVRDLHAVSHRPDIPMEFVIQNSSVPNAWAIPGHVAITRGLLASLESEAQFAFVMGHEIGHVTARHTARQYTRSVLQGIALGGGAMVLGEERGWLLNAAAIGSTLFLLRYSRDQELESDRLGVTYMARAGYRPEEAVNAHRRLLEAVNEYSARMGKETPEGNFLSELLSTHPRTEVRLEEVESIAREVKPRGLKADGINAERFNSQLASLRRIQQGYIHHDRALTLYRNRELAGAQRELDAAMNIDRNQPPFHNLQGLINLRAERIGEAESSFRRALAVNDNYQPAWQSLGVLYFGAKRFEEAIPPLRKSLEIFPQNPLSNYVLGLSFFRLERIRDSIPHLEVYRDAAPRDEEIHGILGICYEAVGDLARAYESYRLQVQVAPNTDIGRHARERMAVLEQRLRR